MVLVVMHTQIDGEEIQVQGAKEGQIILAEAVRECRHTRALCPNPVNYTSAGQLGRMDFLMDSGKDVAAWISIVEHRGQFF
jgi:hypothetical protein